MDGIERTNSSSEQFILLQNEKSHKQKEVDKLTTRIKAIANRDDNYQLEIFDPETGRVTHTRADIFDQKSRETGPLVNQRIALNARIDEISKILNDMKSSKL